MSYTANEVDSQILEGNSSYKNSKGNHECVHFVQTITNAPFTGLWKKGLNVLEAPIGSIKEGTAIATFEGENYPSSNRHAALYLKHDANGIWVFDQWNRQGMVKKRYIRKKPVVDVSVDNAIRYFVIELK